ncbi:MAG: alanine--tRNA ligase [Chloroflexi bacterium]|nr:alanine--tRNA ligase [Chloroflexota bacterium]
MDSHELRESFLRFFEGKEHRRVPGAPLVPPGDPTLLFTSAGMVQMKPYFTGQAEPPASRMVSVQKCFRTSDIESVGDASHLTFFEMLGNFAVGDYFKAEAIPWAWEFLTEVLKLDGDRMWPAVYLDDDESYALWRKLGVPVERLLRYGEDQNYWFSGEVGPCGPDSEIHYDFGEQFGCGVDCEPSHDDCERFVEIWNLVFMSFYCDGDKREPLPSKNIDTGAGLERITSVLMFESDQWDQTKLPSVYETDLFAPIIRKIEQLSGKKYGSDDETDRAIRIVAEHTRAVTFLIGDERTPVVPSNEERGYVARRMLRRAVYFGRRRLGIGEPFMAEVADTIVDHMAQSHEELERQRSFIREIIEPEEQRFDETLQRGLAILEDGLVPMHRRIISVVDGGRKSISKHLDGPAKARDAAARLELNSIEQELEKFTVMGLEQDERSSGAFRWTALTEGFAPAALSEVLSEVDGYRDSIYPSLTEAERLSTEETQIRLDSLVDAARRLSGSEAFLLHDTYGFPIELTREIAAERDLAVDEKGFEAEMEKQRERARAGAGGADAVAADTLFGSLAEGETNFRGYDALEAESEVVALVVGGEEATDAGDGTEVQVLVAETPFYPEGGGQVGDRGELVGPSGRVVVEDTQRVAGRLIVHSGRVIEGGIAKGDRVTARVDAEHRWDTMRNHTATHLAHAALRQVLGTHVRQAGSLVAPGHLRFDFTHTEAVTKDQLVEVEQLVNSKVRQDLAVDSRTTTFDQAMSEGVLAFFGDKYGEEVRVVEVNTVLPKFSAELCGGTHCHRTGEVGTFVITGESSIGSGMRRIEALTGRGAAEYVRRRLDDIDEAARRLGAPRDALVAKIESLVAEQDALRKRIEKMERSLASAPTGDQILERATEVEGVKLLVERVDAPSMDALRYMGDAMRKGIGSGVVVLASVVDGRPQFIAIVTPDVIERGPKAGEILKRVAAMTGGGGGGRPDMAQGGGKDASKVDEALAAVSDIVREMLGGKPR